MDLLSRSFVTQSMSIYYISDEMSATPNYSLQLVKAVVYGVVAKPTLPSEES